MVDNKTPNDDSAEDPIELVPELEPYAKYLCKQVAVQLKTPLIGIDATMECDAEGRLPLTEDGERILRYVTKKGVGWPALAPKRDEELKPIKGPDGATTPKMEVVVFGELRATPCGTSLLLLRPSDSGAGLATLLSHKNIDYVTIVVGVPDAEVIREQRIVEP